MAFEGPFLYAGGDASSNFIVEQKHKNTLRQVFKFDNYDVERSSVVSSVSKYFSSQETEILVPPSPKTSLPFSRRPVRSVTEQDLQLLSTGCHNVLTPFQRHDAISIVHMVSSTMFMAVSHFGNERPSIGRFLAISKAIRELSAKGRFSPPTTFSSGCFYLVSHEGEFARTVLISESRSRPGFLRFACLDIHAVIDVPVSNVFCVPREMSTAVIPCNLFVAKIHGIRAINKVAVRKYLSLFNDRETPISTCCVIHAGDLLNCLSIDFVVDGRWISQMLLSQNEAAPSPFSSNSFDALPSPTAVRRIIQAMLEEGAYDFAPNASIHDTARVSLVRADLLPGYHQLLGKICPSSPLLKKQSLESKKVCLDEKPPSLEVCVKRGEISDPGDCGRFDNRLEELKAELSIIRKDSGTETDALLSGLIWDAVVCSPQPDSEWTQQLIALFQELGRNTSPI